jgi:2-C-methyl-D-erythritol 2,4-cyclodiphosphate synthase
MAIKDIRIGQGIDSHVFEEGRDLILGGIKIPHVKGLKGHSDADALLHALCDAMLGALSLGDMGKHFSDTNPKWKGYNSENFLETVNAMVLKKGWKLLNMDATIMLELPKLAPYIEAIRNNISSIIACDKEQISVKATTMEKMGSIGREEGIMASVSVLLCPK